MSLGRAFGVMGAIAGTMAVAHLLTKKNREIDPSASRRYEDCVFDQVNLARRSKGLAEVTRDPVLDQTGHYYSGLMRGTGKFAHQIDGKSVGERLDSFRIPYHRAAENLQRNDYVDCDSGCMETVWGPGGWMKSKLGHREAMLDPGYDQAGIGVEDDGRSWHVAMYFRKA